MDPLRFALAVVPLAAYLAVLGVLNLRRRPFLTSGASDLIALGLALSGLVFVGPISLFRPEAATVQFVNYVWVFLLTFYWLWVALAALVTKPRLVIYNITPEELRPLLAEAAAKLDPQPRWAGDSLVLPSLGVQLHVDGFALLRNTSLVSNGPRQDIAGWRQLAVALRKSLHRVRVRRNPPAVTLLALSVVLLVASVGRMLADRQQVAEARTEILAFGWDRD